MVAQEAGTGERARMREERADLEMLLLLAASEVARKRERAEDGAASPAQEAADPTYRL